MTLLEVLKKHNRHALAFHAQAGSDETSLKATQRTQPEPIFDRDGLRRDLEDVRKRCARDFLDCKRMIVWPFLLGITFIILLAAFLILVFINPQVEQSWKVVSAVFSLALSSMVGFVGVRKNDSLLANMQRLWREKEATETLLAIAVNLNDTEAIERILFLIEKRLERSLDDPDQ